MVILHIPINKPNFSGWREVAKPDFYEINVELRNNNKLIFWHRLDLDLDLEAEHTL